LGPAPARQIDAPHRRLGEAGRDRQHQLRAGKPSAHGQTFVRRKSPELSATIPTLEVDGPQSGKLIVLSWGGTYGSCATAATPCKVTAGSVAHAHFAALESVPRKLGDVLKHYEKVLIRS